MKLKLKNEIDGFNDNYILNVSEDDLLEVLQTNYTLEAPSIHEDKVHIIETEVDVELRIGRSHPSKGVRVKISIPFEGDAELLQYIPSKYTFSRPRGEIIGQEIHLIYEMVTDDADEFKKVYMQELDEIKQYVEWVREDVKNFNDSLKSFAGQSVRLRKKKILDAYNLVSALEIPIKLRNDLPQTYAIPIRRKKPKIELPEAITESFEPEPCLIEEEYENILEIIYNMTLVMERSPKTFSELDEEAIRNHFLIQLNGQYEGGASGETFNNKGKTDILIREDGKNVFIAECKFWNGKRGMLKTIDQLLGYTCWRDTKIAILLFNKNRNFSSVINKIDPVVKAHNCYKRDFNLKNEKLRNETIFSYIFHQPNDKNRELILTVMAFDIPR